MRRGHAHEDRGDAHRQQRELLRRQDAAGDAVDRVVHAVAQEKRSDRAEVLLRAVRLVQVVEHHQRPADAEKRVAQGGDDHVDDRLGQVQRLLLAVAPEQVIRRQHDQEQAEELLEQRLIHQPGVADPRRAHHHVGHDRQQHLLPLHLPAVGQQHVDVQRHRHAARHRRRHGQRPMQRVGHHLDRPAAEARHALHQSRRHRGERENQDPHIVCLFRFVSAFSILSSTEQNCNQNRRKTPRPRIDRRGALRYTGRCTINRTARKRGGDTCRVPRDKSSSSCI